MNLDRSSTGEAPELIISFFRSNTSPAGGRHQQREEQQQQQQQEQEDFNRWEILSPSFPHPLCTAIPPNVPQRQATPEEIPVHSGHEKNAKKTPNKEADLLQQLENKQGKTAAMEDNSGSSLYPPAIPRRQVTPEEVQAPRKKQSDTSNSSSSCPQQDQQQQVDEENHDNRSSLLLPPAMPVRQGTAEEIPPLQAALQDSVSSVDPAPKQPQRQSTPEEIPTRQPLSPRTVSSEEPPNTTPMTATPPKFPGRQLCTLPLSDDDDDSRGNPAVDAIVALMKEDESANVNHADAISSRLNSLQQEEDEEELSSTAVSMVVSLPGVLLPPLGIMDGTEEEEEAKLRRSGSHHSYPPYFKLKVPRKNNQTKDVLTSSSNQLSAFPHPTATFTTSRSSNHEKGKGGRIPRRARRGTSPMPSTMTNTLKRRQW
jgi:hypothetical protein